MKPADFNVHELIEAVNGTCNTIDDHLPEGMEFEDLTGEDHDVIDNEIFLCNECGWWCEVHEAHETDDGDDICDDCHEARGED